jgi:hypothetical protein
MLGPVYAAAVGVARLAAAVAPSRHGKVWRSLGARRGIRERYTAWGAVHRDQARPLLWMHAPSVGEGLQARPVLERLGAAHADVQVAYTHFSPSAEHFARSLGADFADYLPFDSPGDARAALDALRPTALVYSKLDVWPVLTREAVRRGVPVGLISATLAAGSGRRSRLAALVLGDNRAVAEAVLAGIYRSATANESDLVLPAWDTLSRSTSEETAANYAALILAREGKNQPLAWLSGMVMGGTVQSQGFRGIAGWYYAKLLNQTDTLLKKALAD